MATEVLTRRRKSSDNLLLTHPLQKGIDFSSCIIKNFESERSSLNIRKKMKGRYRLEDLQFIYSLTEGIKFKMETKELAFVGKVVYDAYYVLLSQVSTALVKHQNSFIYRNPTLTKGYDDMMKEKLHVNNEVILAVENCKIYLNFIHDNYYDEYKELAIFCKEYFKSCNLASYTI